MSNPTKSQTERLIDELAQEYKNRVLKRLEIMREHLEAANTPLEIESAVYFITDALVGTKALVEKAYGDLHTVTGVISAKTPVEINSKQ